MSKNLSLPWGNTVKIKRSGTLHIASHIAPRPPSPRHINYLEVAAILISTVAAGSALWQTALVRDQLIAADRNRSIQTVLEKMQAFCDVISDLPFEPIVKLSNAAEPTEFSVSWRRIKGRTLDDAYLRKLSSDAQISARKLSDAIAISLVWSRKPETGMNLSGTMSIGDRELIVAIGQWVLDTSKRIEYRNLNMLERPRDRHLLGWANHCVHNYRQLANLMTGRTIYTDLDTGAPFTDDATSLLTPPGLSSVSGVVEINGEDDITQLLELPLVKIEDSAEDEAISADDEKRSQE